MRKLFITALLVLSALALGIAAAWAGAGTTGADFLQIPIGPRQVAMGDQGTALADDAFSLAYNPASLFLLPTQEVAAMHNIWAEGINQDYVAYAHPRLAGGAVGASLNILQTGSFQGYDASGGAAGNISASDMAASFAYARHLWGEESPEFGPGVTAGASLTFLRERLENDSSSGLSGDLGAMAHFPVRDVLANVGLAVRNLGSSPSYYGRKVSLPRTIALGVSGMTRRFWGDPLTLSMEVSQTQGLPIAFGVGAEYWLTPVLAARVGFRDGDDIGPGVRAGFGLKIKFVEFDYGMAMMGNFGVSHRIGVSVKFGAPVERMPELSPQMKAANAAIARGKKLIGDGRYLEALLELNRALELDPNSPEALQMLEQVQKILRQREQTPAP